MNRTNAFLVFFVFYYLQGFTQPYYNKIIDSDFNNLTLTSFHVLDNEIYIPYLFASQNGAETSLIIVNGNEQEEHLFSFFRMGLNPVVFDGQQLYLVGEHSSNALDNSILLGKTSNLNSDFEWLKAFDVIGQNTINSGFACLDNSFFILNVNYLDSSQTTRAFQLFKIDKEGNIIFNKILNSEFELNYCWELLVSSDQNILISNGIHYFNKLGRFAQLVKLDTSGEVIWSTEGKEKFDNGAVPSWIAELNNGQIVQSYQVNKLDDPEYSINGWNKKPFKLKWYDEFGDSIYAKTLITPRLENLNISQIKKGNGDYFFVYGFYEESIEDNYYGFINKLSYSGDTLWSKRYRHPDHNKSNIFHNIQDLYEFDNGDIVAMGSLSESPGVSNIWLLRIGDNGCLGTDDCGSVVTPTNEVQLLKNKLTIYPNPTSGEFFIDSDNLHLSTKIDILDNQGNLIKSMSNTYGEIDLVNYPSGIYFIRLHLMNDIQFTKMILKL